MHKLPSNIYVDSSFPGVTVGVIVTRQGLICVDTPSHPADAQKWRTKLSQLSSKPILYVINTDHHRDRVLGNQWFDAPVIAHHFTGERLRLYPEILKGNMPDAVMDFEMAREFAGVRVLPPQITFSHELVLLKGDHEIVLRHMPGSAPGAVWVMIPKAGVVFTGDAVVTETHLHLGNADIGQWLESLNELRKARFPAKTIVPGRGKPTNKESLKWTQNYLKLAGRKMDALINNNRSRSDVAGVAADLLKHFPVPDAQRETLARRLRLDLERLYDTRRGSEDV
ncbi:MAG: MBL fold metallo-hydrolase [Chloroflexi bacterium]|nr:MBL fold metallo-hydrolase [Chloroflexota bacterium]